MPRVADDYDGCRGEGDCRIKININLTALLAGMERGVERFLSEYPELDKEKGKWEYLTWGIVDFRAPIH